ncbi:MAG: nitroreductase/quinone reductase family protein [Gaiellaceae bacterium]
MESARRHRLVRSVTHYGGAFHRFLYRVSGGRIGGRVWGLRVVLLTTTGRRSGKRRTVPLCALREGEDVVVIASYGGLDRAPAWSLNLDANPEAELQDGRVRRPVVARTASGEERTRLWTAVTTTAPGYLEYERRTAREIAVVILEPRR